MHELGRVVEGFCEIKGYTNRDKALGVICLCLGGPRLLYMLNQAKIVPSRSTIQQNLTPMLPLYQQFTKDLLKESVKKYVPKPESPTFYSIQTDDMFVNESVHYKHQGRLFLWNKSFHPSLTNQKIVQSVYVTSIIITHYHLNC